MAKIVLFGNHSVPYCSEVQYTSELRSLGHEVITLQETVASSEEVLEKSLQSDALVWIHSHGCSTPGGLTMLQALKKLKGAGVPSIAFHLDLYLGLERWKEYEDNDYFKVDHFFTVDKLMADWFNKNTATKGYYLTAGAFSEQCYLADYDPNYASDVCFIGSYGYHKEWPWRAQIVDWLKETYGNRFTHWGGDGKELVRQEKFNKVCASTKIIVGDSLCLNFDYPYYWSERVYNVTGAGGFILHPFIEGLQDSFKIGEEIACFTFGDFDGLKRRIDAFLDNEALRNKIRIAGQLRTIKDHTYRKRWQTILETVGIS